jgi:hypothetical protein
MAAAAAVKEALWLKTLIAELDWGTGCIEVQGDNQAAMHILQNPVVSQRAKHIDVVHLFVRERVARGEVKFAYCSSENNVADIFTKALGKQLHEKHVRALGLF